MMTQSETAVRAERDDIESLISALEPLSGGIWLATDLTTHVHWTVMADSIRPVIEMPDGRICRAYGLVTVSAPGGEPVFLIHEHDTLHWIESGHILAIRELGHEDCEIRLERLDDLDARLNCAFNLTPLADAMTVTRTISVGHSRYLQIYDEQLPTGNPATDAALHKIETTIEARRTLVGPSAGTLDVMAQMARDLDMTLNSHAVRSYIWAAVLREQIAHMRQSLDA